ncbi:MAG: sigma-70 family RNA polymerase sigma factor [Myxococcaceae bacterium]
MSELLDRSVAGDDAALAALVRAYHDRVHRFGRRVCRDGFDADDAVQEAFTTLARRPDVQGSPAVLSWLFTVVRNACLGLLRPFAKTREPLSSTHEETLAADALPPDEALARFELVSKVHEALRSLDPEARAVLVLRDLEGLSGEATAERLGLSLAAMKSRLHRARLSVREALTAD